MKNLKKVLSLALAFAMVLGLVVVGSAQDVTTLADWDTVTDKDSAVLLNAFSIMKGDADGNFYPEKNVSRVEAAAMISRALWGGKDSVGLYASGNVGGYVDVIPGYWYMGYVNFLSVTGVMTGKLEGKFDPDGTVTGYELLKMALVALGYDAETEGLTGAGWDLRTMALATDRNYVDLTEGTTVLDWSAPLTRMNAATIIANMIWRETVSYSLITGALVPSGTSFGVDVLGMVTEYGTLLGNEQGYITDTYVTQINATDEVNAGIYVTGMDAIYTTLESDITDLGGPVLLYFAGNKLVSATVAGTEVEATRNSSGAITNSENVSTVPFGAGTKAYGETVYTDWNGNGKFEQTTTLGYDVVAKVTDVVETETFGTLYALNNAKWNAKNDKDSYTLPNTFIQANKSNIEAVKDDYIVYTTVANTLFNGVSYTYGHVLTPVEGKVTRVSTSNGVTYDHIDGVAYVHTTDPTTSVAFGSEGTFYVYPNSAIGEFVGVNSGAATPTYAVIYDAGWEYYGQQTSLSGNNGVIVEVNAILETGVADTFEVASASNLSGNGETYLVADMTATTIVETTNGTSTGIPSTDSTPAFTDGLFATGGLLTNVNENAPLLVQYTLNDDGTLNIVKLDAGVANGATTTITAGSALVASNTYVTADTVSFVQTDATAGKQVWTVVKGTDVSLANGQSITTVTDTYIGTTSKATYLLVPNAALPQGSSVAFYYVLSNDGQVGLGGNGNIYEVTVYNGSTGEVETIETTGTIAAGEFYTGYSGGALTGLLANSKYSYGFITGVEGELIELSDTDTNDTPTPAAYTVGSTTGYHFIDGENSTALTAAELSVQETAPDTVDGNGNTVNAYAAIVIHDGDSTAEHVIVFPQ